MVENLYDTILSLFNQVGYLDHVSNKTSKLTFDKKNRLKKIPYTVVGFTYDEFFRIPHKCLID